MQLGNLAFLSGIFSSTSSNHASHMSRLSFVGKARRRLGGWNIRKGMKWGKLHFDLGSFLVAGWRKNDPSDRWVVGFFGKFLDESCFQGGGSTGNWANINRIKRPHVHLNASWCNSSDQTKKEFLPPSKTDMAIENPPFKDLFQDFPLPC